VASLSFQKQMEYKFNFFSGLLFSFIPFATNLLLWFVIYQSQGVVFGFSFAQMVSYYFVIFIVENLLRNNSDWSIEHDIRTGDINRLLIKPVNYALYNISMNVWPLLVFLVLGSIPVAVLGFLLRDFLTISLTWETALTFVVSMIIAYIINFYLSYLMSMLAFFLNDISSLLVAVNVLRGIVSGAVFPISLIPSDFYYALLGSPFPYTGYFPTLILMGEMHDTWSYMAVGACWCILLYALSKWCWIIGMRKYSAFGG